MTTKAKWRVNTPQLLKEVLMNQGSDILNKPIQIFASLLEGVADRASELNDPKLNALMCRLALYAESDPYNSEYNEKKTNEVINQV
jgi:hypothetical protein